MFYALHGLAKSSGGIMSEKLFNLLLQLYPSRFRREYGDQAAQLFRDRLRDEQGFFLRLRLWIDLLIDLVSSLPREYRRAPSVLRPARVQTYSGVPSFRVLEDQPLRPGTFFFGSLLALVALGLFEFLLSHGANKPLGASSSRPPASSAKHSSVSPGSAKHLSGNAQADAAPYRAANASAINQAAGTRILGELQLDDVERQLVISEIITNLIDHYPDPDTAQKIADELSTQQNKGAYHSIAGGHAFASLLTSQMRSISHDDHLRVVYGDPTPEDGSTPIRFYPIDDYFRVAIPEGPPIHP